MASSSLGLHYPKCLAEADPKQKIALGLKQCVGVTWCAN